jgi:hypothetical protein
MSHYTQTPPVGTQEERDLDTRLDHAIANSSTLVEEALKQLAKPSIAHVEDDDNEDDILEPRLDQAMTSSSTLLSEALAQLAAEPCISPIDNDNKEDDILDNRLNHLIATSSSLTEKALEQLAAKPCMSPTAPTAHFNEEYDDEDEDEEHLLQPLNNALQTSSHLLTQARAQLSLPSTAPQTLTPPELLSQKTAQAWSQTYHLIEDMNTLRSETSQSLYFSVLQDIDEEEEVKYDSSDALAMKIQEDHSWVASQAVKKGHRRTISRKCNGVRVAAVVASIEAKGDEEVPLMVEKEKQRHVRNSSVRSFR